MREEKKVAVLVNQVAPYRVPIYREIARNFKTSIFVSGFEANRSEWSACGLNNELYALKRSWGVTLKLKKYKGGHFFDYKFLHVNPGFMYDLIKFRPDAVLSNEMGFRTIVALVYGILFRVPTWVWWGGTIHTERSNGFIKRSVRYLLSKLINRWISYGETSTEYLMSIGVARDKILQIQNSVDENVYKINKNRAINEKPVILYVGQMIDRKGVETLLQAAGCIQREGYEFSLVLVGSGPRLCDYKRIAEELDLKSTTFMPALKPDDMPALYDSADFLVFPTLEDVWGLVVNEALLSGLSVLSSIYAGCTKEILPVECHFDPLNSNDFCNKLKLLLDNKLPKLDLSPLLPIGEVANTIVHDIRNKLYSK